MADKNIKYSITVTEHDQSTESGKSMMLFIYDNNEVIAKQLGVNHKVEQYNLLAKSTRLIAAYLQAVNDESI